MPPRIRPSRVTSASNVLHIPSNSSPLLPFLLPSYHVLITLPPQTSSSSSRQFSTTPSLPAGRKGSRFEKTPGKRNGFLKWMKTHGKRLNRPNVHGNVPQYLTLEPRPLPLTQEAMKEGASFKNPAAHQVDWEKAKEVLPVSPFPTNPLFKVHPVISTGFRDEIYNRIKMGRSVRRVSAEMNCELERVAAVVRLKEIENSWVQENRPLCTKMQTVVHSMMPVTKFEPGTIISHESITDLRIHPATNNQLFLSVPESARFTRKSAADALGILPADKRMPHSELIDIERLRLQGKGAEDVIAQEKMREEKEAEAARAKRELAEIRKKRLTVVENGRWRFRLTPATTGQVGFRYGAPHEDRKRGVLKIPKRVE